MHYQILPGGRLSVRRHLALQALRPNAQWRIGAQGYFFQSTAKVTSARAWHVAPGGRARRNWNPPVDLTLDDSFLTDNKARFVWVDGVRRGSLVFFEFAALDTPHFMSLFHLFLEDGPIDLARFQLEAPPDWSIRAEWLRGEGPTVVEADGVRTWEIKDIPYPDSAPLGPSWADEAPALAVQAVPAEGTEAVLPTFSDWAAVSSWYEGLVKERDKITPSIQSAADGACADAGPGLLDRVKAAGTYVRDNVRYIAIEIGIGGWQPHEASETLGRLYGDCKDKGTLFRALLSAEGIRSYPVLVNLTTSRTISRTLPVLGFNHFVVAVPLPADLEVPPAFQAAVADGGDLGRLLIVDTTDDRLAIGSISEGLSGKLGLVVADGAMDGAARKGRLVELPHGAAAHRIERRLRIDLHKDRSQSIARASRYLGEFAASARSDYGVSTEERQEVVRSRVDGIWTGAELISYAAEPETADGSFMETATLQVGAPPGRDDGLEVELFPGADGDLPRVPLARRTQPVEYGHGRALMYDVTIHPIPEDVSLHSARQEQGEGWRMVTSYERKADTVKARWEMMLTRTRFQPGDFGELRRFWSAVSSITSQSLWVPLGPGQAPAGGPHRSDQPAGRHLR